MLLAAAFENCGKTMLESCCRGCCIARRTELSVFQWLRRRHRQLRVQEVPKHRCSVAVSRGCEGLAATIATGGCVSSVWVRRVKPLKICCCWFRRGRSPMVGIPFNQHPKESFEVENNRTALDLYFSKHSRLHMQNVNSNPLFYNLSILQISSSKTLKRLFLEALENCFCLSKYPQDLPKSTFWRLVSCQYVLH